MKSFAVAIFGPTGVGKSSNALTLAENIGEIISVDSMQVYKYMDIGTAKPSKEDQKRVKHHLIDIIPPNIQFNAGDFVRLSKILIQDIIKKNKIPFLVGGTGLYFLSLMRGMVDIPKIDTKIKEYLLDKWHKIGQIRMFNILKRFDYDYSLKIHQNDKQRTLRALEVFLGTKRKFSDYLKLENNKNDIQYIKIGINVERNSLYELINKRVDLMIKSGLIDEVKNLLSMGYTKNDPGLRAIGYAELIDYFNGAIDLNKAIELIKQNSRHYAKRQITWFKKIPDVKWFNNNQNDEIRDFIYKSLK
jgi:tRNA dimethylallyltransferase